MIGKDISEIDPLIPGMVSMGEVEEGHCFKFNDYEIDNMVSEFDIPENEVGSFVEDYMMITVICKDTTITDFYFHYHVF